VQGHCQHHHRSAAQPAFWPLSLLTADMQVGYQMIQGKQKQHAEPKSGKRREKGEPSQLLRLFDCRDQQAPDRCRHHHTGGKACK